MTVTTRLIILFLIYITGKNAEVVPPANFKSTIVLLNHTLQLNCQVSEKEYDKIVWTKGENELLAVGSVIFTTDNRINFQTGGILQIEMSQKSDSGFYACQSGARNDQNQKQFFQVVVQDFRCPVLVAPKHGTIKYVHLKGQVPFTDGTIAVYFCDNGFSLSSNDNTRNCTHKTAVENSWDGNDPLCTPEELFLLEKRLTELEIQLEQQTNPAAKLIRERYSGFPTDRLSRVEKEMSHLQRQQEDLRDWIIRTMQIMNTTSTEQHNSNVSDETHTIIQHQLNEMWMRVNLLHNELQSRMEDIEKSLDVASNQAINFLREPNSKTATRLTDISSLVSLRLGLLENETKNLEDALHAQNKLMEHAGAMNAIAAAWEEAQKVAVARMRLVDGGRLIWEYIWILNNIDGKIKKSVENGHYSIQSSAFYTGVPGYRFRMVLYPNFSESNQIGLFAGLLPGEFDDTVKWPFSWDYHMGVISHNAEEARDHVGIISMPPVTCDLSNFQRPVAGAPPSACGFRHFLSHNTLNDHRKAFVTNGHLWVRMRVYAH